MFMRRQDHVFRAGCVNNTLDEYVPQQFGCGYGSAEFTVESESETNPFALSFSK